MNDPKWYVREEAINKLKKLSWKPETIKEKVTVSVSELDFFAVKRFGEPAVDPLCDILSTLRFDGAIDDSLNVMGNIIYVLGGIADKKGIDAIKEFLKRSHKPLPRSLREISDKAIKNIEWRGTK